MFKGETESSFLFYVCLTHGTSIRLGSSEIGAQVGSNLYNVTCLREAEKKVFFPSGLATKRGRGLRAGPLQKDLFFP